MISNKSLKQAKRLHFSGPFSHSFVYIQRQTLHFLLAGVGFKGRFKRFKGKKLAVCVYECEDLVTVHFPKC